MGSRYTTLWSSYRNGYVMAHIAIAERVLGRRLPEGAVVHHVDNNGRNNEHSNLVVCPNQEYHFLLHMRQEAYDACGDVNKRKCVFCRQYDFVEKLFLQSKGNRAGRYYHRACYNAHRRARYAQLGYR